MPLQAQAPTEAVRVFTPDFFATAQLSTAYDMVQLLPGFIFNEGTTARGYSGTAGNVLINGDRPAAKSDSLSSILRRIPADDVERIQLVRGGMPGLDMHGHSMVANVILRRQSAFNTIVSLQTHVFGDGHVIPGTSVEFSLRDGDKSFALTLSRLSNANTDDAGRGYILVEQPGQGDLRAGLVRRGAEQLGWGINSAASVPLLDGTLNATASWRRTRFNRREAYDAPFSTHFLSGSRAQSGEVGMNWRGDVGNAEMNLAVLGRQGRNDATNIGESAGNIENFASRQFTSETILRASLRHASAANLMLEAGLEGALNTLRAVSDFQRNGVDIILPGSQVRANERRGEAHLQGTWSPTAQWSVAAGARMEFSRIGAAGVAPRDLSYLKPRLLLSWTPGSGRQVRLRAERQVGQLNLANFGASADLSRNGVSAGNLALLPDQRWQYEATYEQGFWEKGALTLSYLHEEISDLVDYVPIGNGLDGRGNIPHATRDQIRMDLTLPLDRMGLEGAQLKGALRYTLSDVVDPVTGVSRSISNQRNHDINVSYRQDLPDWNSSFEVNIHVGQWEQTSWRIAQISAIRLLTPGLDLNWTYKPQADLDLHFEAYNIIPYRMEVDQLNYAGPRDVAAVAARQILRSNSQPRFLVRLRKTF